MNFKNIVDFFFSDLRIVGRNYRRSWKEWLKELVWRLKVLPKTTLVQEQSEHIIVGSGNLHIKAMSILLGMASLLFLCLSTQTFSSFPIPISLLLLFSLSLLIDNLNQFNKICKIINLTSLSIDAYYLKLFDLN